jgi:hypothetical protein
LNEYRCEFICAAFTLKPQRISLIVILLALKWFGTSAANAASMWIRNESSYRLELQINNSNISAFSPAGIRPTIPIENSIPFKSS